MQNHPYQRIKVLEDALSSALEYLARLPHVPATRAVAEGLERVLNDASATPRAWVGDLVLPSGIPVMHAEVVDQTLLLSSDVRHPYDAVLLERLRSRDAIFDLQLQQLDAPFSELELALFDTANSRGHV